MLRRRAHEDGELNLSALIDIFSIMLFFLMTTVTFLTLKTLNASVPAVAKKGQSVDTKDGVNVSVEVTADGYVLKASGQPQNSTASRLNINENIGRKPTTVKEKNEAGEEVEKEVMGLNTQKLTEELWEIKKKAPEVKVIMIFPEDGVEFQDIVSTMDASREMPSIIDRNKRVPLFTRPVLSELVK